MLRETLESLVKKQAQFQGQCPYYMESVCVFSKIVCVGWWGSFTYIVLYEHGQIFNSLYVCYLEICNLIQRNMDGRFLNYLFYVWL